MTAPAAAVPARCHGCSRPLYATEDGNVCIGCANARMVSMLCGGCRCGPVHRRERLVNDGTRKWTMCDRCLGEVVKED